MIRKKGAIFCNALLAAVLCMSLVPATALAEETVSLAISPHTLTAGYAANIVVEVIGGHISGDGMTARIQVNGEDYTAPLENGRAVIYVPLSANIGPGDYTIDVLADGEVKQSGTIQVLSAFGLWKVGIYYNQELDTFALDVVFAESIKPRDSNYSVTVNGKAVACMPAGDTTVRIVQALSGDLMVGQKCDVVVSGVKYKDHFPSYSFSFAISYVYKN